MAEPNFLTSAQVAESFVQWGLQKASLTVAKTFLLALLAGVYIGFGAHLATVVGTGECEYFGLKRLLVGASFSVGLMLVVIPGAELFTGNNLLSVGLCAGRVCCRSLLRNWLIVYIGNLLGSIALAAMIGWGSGLLDGEVGANALTIAAAKTSGAPVGGLSHSLAFFFRGVGCNWLVCLAVMMAVASRDIISKMISCLFPIMAFVASSFEHCVANMYFIPAAIFAKAFPRAVELSGLSPSELAGINWTSMWTQNLLTVTLGNIVAGALFVGAAYFYVYVKDTPACGGASDAGGKADAQ